MKFGFWAASILTLAAIFFFFKIFQIAVADLPSIIVKEQIKVSELGDFLSGLFSPIAFLWLIVTMFMQKNELELQRKSVDAQLEEMRETREILTGESNYLRETTEFQKEVLILQRINTLREEIGRKSEIIVKRYRDIDTIKGELPLESIVRFLRTSIDAREHVVLNAVRNKNEYVDLTKLVYSYIDTIENLSKKIFFESLFQDFNEIEKVLRGMEFDRADG